MGLPETFKGRELCHAVGFAPFVLKQKQLLLQGLSNCRIRASNTIFILKVLWKEEGKWNRKSKMADLRQNKIITLLQQLEAME